MIDDVAIELDINHIILFYVDSIVYVYQKVHYSAFKILLIITLNNIGDENKIEFEKVILSNDILSKLTSNQLTKKIIFVMFAEIIRENTVVDRIFLNIPRSKDKN